MFAPGEWRGRCRTSTIRSVRSIRDSEAGHASLSVLGLSRRDHNYEICGPMKTLLTSGRILSVFPFLAASLSGTDGTVTIERPEKGKMHHDAHATLVVRTGSRRTTDEPTAV